MAAKKASKKTAKKSSASTVATAQPRKKVRRLTAKQRSAVKGNAWSPRNMAAGVTSLHEQGFDMESAHGQVILGLYEDAMNGDHAARKLLLERLDAVGVQAPSHITVLTGVPNLDGESAPGLLGSGTVKDAEFQLLDDNDDDDSSLEPPTPSAPHRQRKTPGSAAELSDDEVIARRKKRIAHKARETRERKADKGPPAPTRVYPAGDGPRIKQPPANSTLLD